MLLSPISHSFVSSCAGHYQRNKENSLRHDPPQLSRPCQLLGRRRLPLARPHILNREPVGPSRGLPCSRTSRASGPMDRPGRVVLPRRLTRPPPCAVNRELLDALDPALKGIPLGFIIQNLQERGPSMLADIRAVRADTPTHNLPREVTLQVGTTCGTSPTHVLAIYSQLNAASQRRCAVTLFPAHALVMAANCAHIGKAFTTYAKHTSKSTPVVPLCIPSPETFSLVLRFIYTKMSDALVCELLPLASTPAQSRQEMAEHCALSTKILLLERVRKVQGLWSNGVALGLTDDRFFDTLEMVWDVLLRALVIAAKM